MEVTDPIHGNAQKASKRRRSKRKVVELEYDSLLNALETRLSVLESCDKSFDWILHCLKKWKRDTCFCQSFVDELSALKECRQIFRDDVFQLKDDVECCRRRCEDQMAMDKKEVARHRKKCNKSVENAKAEAKEKKKVLLSQKTLALETELELKALASEKAFLERRQSVLDGEEEMLNREEALAAGRRQLEELEKELEESEALLQKRQKMCDRKQEDLINLHEELKELRLGLDSQQSEASERAQRNWEILRRDLQDRHQLLESNIQKYRTELASASATITGKDIHINKLNQQITELSRVIEDKDQKIRQLESRLAMALTETVKSDLTNFNQWRTNRGSFRSDSAIDQASNFSSADDSLPNSPMKFNGKNPFLHKYSIKANGIDLANGTSERKSFRLSQADDIKVTSPKIQRHHYVNGTGDTIPTKDKENSSSACNIM